MSRFVFFPEVNSCLDNISSKNASTCAHLFSNANFLENNITSPLNINFCFQKKTQPILRQQSSPLRCINSPTHLSQALLSGGYRDFAMNFCRQQRLPPALCEPIAERLESLTRRLPVKGPGLEAAKVAKAKAKVGCGSECRVVGLVGCMWGDMNPLSGEID